MYFIISIVSFCLGIFGIQNNGVVGQYASDYFDTVDKDVTPYYAARAKQFDEVATANEDIALVRRYTLSYILFYKCNNNIMNFLM